MILVDAIGQPGEQRGAIGAAGEGELFEIPGFAGREREAFGIEHHFDGLRAQEEAAVEAMATGEGEQHGLAAGRRERHHAGDDLGVGGLGNLVVLQFVVGEIDGLAESAGGLGEHLEALAVERGGIGEIVRDAEERDLLDVHGRLAGIGEAGAIEVALAVAGELEGCCGLDGADLRFGMPDIQRRRGGERQHTGEKKGERAKHALYFNAIYENHAEGDCLPYIYMPPLTASTCPVM